MVQQNVRNYRKFNTLHHFVFMPASLVLFFISLFQVFKNSSNNEFFILWIAITSIIFLMIFLSIILRRSYALKLQDRIINIEFKFRYFALTGFRLEDYPYQFSDSQIIALRFSDDKYLLDLISQTQKNNWSPSEIKRNIKDWKADHRRV